MNTVDTLLTEGNFSDVEAALSIEAPEEELELVTNELDELKSVRDEVIDYHLTIVWLAGQEFNRRCRKVYEDYLAVMPKALKDELDVTFDMSPLAYWTDPLTHQKMEEDSRYVKYEQANGEGSWLDLKRDMVSTPSNLSLFIEESAAYKDAVMKRTYQYDN